MPGNKKRKKKSATVPAADATPGNSDVVIHRSTKMTMVGIAVALALVGWLIVGSGPKDETVTVSVPALSATASKGALTFKRVCSDCHGDNAAGSKKGPPLVHPYYRPGHHADGAIRNAIAGGVRPHHWKFGPMPAQPDVEATEIQPLIAYIREMQRANGIN